MSESEETREEFEESVKLKYIKTIGDILVRSFKRSIGICIKPISTFKQISEDPDIVGPLVLIIINILLTVYQLDLLFSRVFEVKNGALVKAVTLGNIIHVMLAWRCFTLIMVWLVLFGINWALLKAFKSDFDSYSLFSGIGYVFILQVLLTIVDILYSVFIIGSSPILILKTLPVVKKEVQINVGLSILFEIYKNRLGQLWFFRKFYQWFFNLWSMLIYTALARGIGNLSWGKAVIVGGISYVLVFILFYITNI